MGLKYKGKEYYYFKNIQGDVIGILDSTGEIVVKYTYDAWGNHQIEDLSGKNLGEVNPFRYRSYYYDRETNFYYLNSRYYDSSVGRFINADDISYLVLKLRKMFFGMRSITQVWWCLKVLY